MKRADAAASSCCMCRCQLLDGVWFLLNYVNISDTMDNSDGGESCCAACYSGGYK